jgi:hypothetical protein
MPDETAESAADDYASFVALVDTLLSISRRELQEAPEVDASLEET